MHVTHLLIYLYAIAPNMNACVHVRAQQQYFAVEKKRIDEANKPNITFISNLFEQERAS